MSPMSPLSPDIESIDRGVLSIYTVVLTRCVVLWKACLCIWLLILRRAVQDKRCRLPALCRPTCGIYSPKENKYKYVMPCAAHSEIGKASKNLPCSPINSLLIVMYFSLPLVFSYFSENPCERRKGKRTTCRWLTDSCYTPTTKRCLTLPAPLTRMGGHLGILVSSRAVGIIHYIPHEKASVPPCSITMGVYGTKS